MHSRKPEVRARTEEGAPHVWGTKHPTDALGEWRLCFSHQYPLFVFPLTYQQVAALYSLEPKFVADHLTPPVINLNFFDWSTVL